MRAKFSVAAVANNATSKPPLPIITRPFTGPAYASSSEPLAGYRALERVGFLRGTTPKNRARIERRSVTRSAAIVRAHRAASATIDSAMSDMKSWAVGGGCPLRPTFSASD